MPIAGHILAALLVVNAGDEPIFALRVGHDAVAPAVAVWSDDLLPFDDVIGVSAGREVKIEVDPAACVQDLQATYRDGHAIVMKAVDLCTADRVDFTH